MSWIRQKEMEKVVLILYEVLWECYRRALFSHPLSVTPSRELRPLLRPLPLLSPLSSSLLALGHRHRQRLPRATTTVQRNMLSVQRRTLYVATASLIAFASSVDAVPRPKGKGSSLKSKKPTTSGTGGDGGNTCYDSQFVAHYSILIWLSSLI